MALHICSLAAFYNDTGRYDDAVVPAESSHAADAILLVLYLESANTEVARGNTSSPATLNELKLCSLENSSNIRAQYWCNDAPIESMRVYGNR